MADWVDLDDLFTLPDYIGEPWRTLYERLIARTRAETAHLPMGTAFQLIIERYITTYIRIRYHESSEVGTPAGFANLTQEKDINAFWLGLAKEFGDQLNRLKPMDTQILNETVKGIIMEVLGSLDDERIRDTLKGRFVAAFDRARM